MPDTDTPVPRTRVLDTVLPPELEVGVFADYASVWHTEAAIVVDFQSARGPLFPADGPNGEPLLVAPGRVVARVRLNPSNAIEFIRALSAQLDAYEAEHKVEKAA